MARTTSLLLISEFQKFISASQKGKRSKYAGRKLSQGTIVQYKCVLKLLKEFEEKESKKFTIELLRKKSLSIIKKEKKYWSSFFQNFISFLYKDKGYYDRYVSSVLKTLNTFFNYLSEEKQYPISKFYKQFRISVETFTPVVLSPEQLQYLIYNKQFEETLSRSLKRTKDIFVFGCTVALRYSDLIGLKKENVINSPEGKYILIHTKKTTTQVKLPLPDYLLPIIERYRTKKGKFLLPRLSSTNLNLQVKELIKKAKWDYSLPKIRYKQGKPQELKTKKCESLRFCDHITTHTMRRTAITTLLILGVPEFVVRKISGHAPGSKEFYRYVAIVQDHMNKQVLEAYSRLSSCA
jgi:integrase